MRSLIWIKSFTTDAGTNAREKFKYAVPFLSFLAFLSSLFIKFTLLLSPSFDSFINFIYFFLYCHFFCFSICICLVVVICNHLLIAQFAECLEGPNYQWLWKMARKWYSIRSTEILWCAAIRSHSPLPLRRVLLRLVGEVVGDGSRRSWLNIWCVWVSSQGLARRNLFRWWAKGLVLRLGVGNASDASDPILCEHG
jgi:hypothetical protein